MALIMMGGWESGTNLDAFTTVTLGTGSGVTTTYRRGAQYSLCFTNNTDLTTYTLSLAKDEIFVQVAVIFTERANVGDYAGRLIRLSRGIDCYATVSVTAAGLLALYRGDASILLATGTTVLTQNRWYNIEVRYKASPTDGVFEVRLDGVTEVSYSGSTCGSLVAQYRFESGALTTDSVGGTTLTNSGSPPTSDAVNYKEGSGSAAFARASTQYFQSADASLPSTFPLKSTNTHKVATVAFWVRFNSLPGSGQTHEIISKTLSGTDNCLEVQLNYNVTPKFRLIWGYTATSNTNWELFTPTTDRWYHVGITINGIAPRIWNARVYDATADSVTNYTGTPGGDLHLSTRDFFYGAYNLGTNTLDGKLDELLFFNAILTDSEIDYIRRNSVAGLTTQIQKVDTVEFCSKTNYTLYLDDVVINDTSGSLNNSWPSNIHVVALNSRSDSTSEWISAPNSTSNWEQVQLFGASQITTGTTNAIELFGFESAPTSISSIAGVQSLISIRAHPTYPAITTLHSLVKVGSTIFESTDIVATKVYAPYLYTWEANPLTGTTWTVDDLNNLKIGVKAIR